MYDLYSMQLNDRMRRLLEGGLRLSGAKFSQPVENRYGEITPATGRDNSAAFYGGIGNSGRAAGISGDAMEALMQQRRKAEAEAAQEQAAKAAAGLKNGKPV